MLLTNILAAAAFFVSQSSAPWSLSNAKNSWWITRHEPGVRCLQFASTDPSGRGEDHGHFLRIDGNRAVLAEMDGPGMIARIWSANPKGKLKIYFNGEENPRVNCNFEELFLNKVPPFGNEYACHDGGGWISYYPMPYEKSCRVEVEDLKNPRELYYQIQYLSYPKDKIMKTFDSQADKGIWVDETNAARFHRSSGGINSLLEYILKRGARECLGKHGGNGEIAWWNIEFPDGVSAEDLRALEIRGEFDGVKTIDVPLGDLFTNGFGPRNFSSACVSWEGDKGFFYLPMPYRKSAMLEIINHGREGIKIKANVNFEKRAPSDWVLHAEFRSTDMVGEELYEFVNAKGPGKFVGITQALQGVGDLWYLEGNEQFFVDGELKPSILGTGTEDFYNGGWYWDAGPLAKPFHGLGVKEEWTTNRTTPYRFFIMDAIPFEKSIIGKIEHGSANQVRDAYYSSVAFWYGPPTPVRDVKKEEFTIPRRFVLRRNGETVLASKTWKPNNCKVEKVRLDSVTDGFRAAEFPLFQQFPISYFKRGEAKLPAEVVKISCNEPSAAYAQFEVKESDLYKVSLRCVGAADSNSAIVGLSPAEGKPYTQLGSIDTERPSAEPFIHTFPSRVFARGEYNLYIAPYGKSPETNRFVYIDSLILEPERQYIKSWWVSPPVECKKDSTVEEAAETEAKILEANFSPKASAWKEVQDGGETLDLNNLVSSKAPVFGYLLTNVFSPEDRMLTMWIGSDDGVRLWVNGELAWSNAVHRPVAPDQDHFSVKLKKGWNRVIVKVKNDDGGYGFCARLAPPGDGMRASTRTND